MSEPKSQERKLGVYGGLNRLSAIVARAGCIDVFDLRGVHLDTFKNVKAASAANNQYRLRTCVPHDGERGDSTE